MAEREEQGMERPEGGARRHRPATEAGQDLIEQVALVLQVTLDPGGGRPRRVPGLAVDAVDAPELKVAGLDLVLEGGDHAEVFPLVEASLRGGEDEQGQAAPAEAQDLHLAPEGRAPFLQILAHASSPTEEFSVRLGRPRERGVRGGDRPASQLSAVSARSVPDSTWRRKLRSP